MDHYQDVVVDWLRADRAMFVNTECCVQLNPGANPDTSGPHWYCDAVAVNFRERQVFLCEVTYAKNLTSLLDRLRGWARNWAGVKAALVRDCSLPADWSVRPWVFVPSELRSTLEEKVATILAAAEGGPDGMPTPLVKELEAVVPWKYRSWDRGLEAQGS